MQDRSSNLWFWGLSGLLAILTIYWCCLIGEGNREVSGLALGLCSASFAVGSLLGFLFTIFGDELEPLGKIRDAMIALASGITGIGIAKAKDFGMLIGSVRLLTHDSSQSSPFSVLVVIAYFVAGFYFMYLVRKLSLNPALANARRAMDRIQVAGSITLVSAALTEKLSQGLLLGREFIEEVDELEDEETKTLRSELYSSEVTKFLEACQDDLKRSVEVDPAAVTLAARLHYYRVYFEKSESEPRRLQEQTALDWISRVLIRDPLNSEFRIKLADIYGLRGRYDEAVSILERLNREDTAPQYVQQWLGYYLLFIEGRELNAIDQSLAYHDRFTDESSGLFNAACGYAQLYTTELAQKNELADQDSENRKKSLFYLKKAVIADLENKALARKHSSEGASFESLATDPEFIQITTPSTGANI